MDREGTLQERHTARSDLFSTYAHLGEREDAMRILTEMETLETEHVEAGLPSPNVAENLMTHLREFTRAKVYLQRALENGSKYLGDDDPPHLEAWFRGLLRWAQIELGDSDQEITGTMERLEFLLGVSFPHADILPCLEKLIDRPAFHEGVEWLLKEMWGEMAYQYRFWGLGDKLDLRKIEVLLERLGTPAKNEL